MASVLPSALDNILPGLIVAPVEAAVTAAVGPAIAASFLQALATEPLLTAAAAAPKVLADALPSALENAVPAAASSYLSTAITQAVAMALQQPDVITTLRDALITPVLQELHYLKDDQVGYSNKCLRALNASLRLDEQFQLLAREKPGIAGGPQLGEVPDTGMYPRTVFDTATMSNESLLALGTFYDEVFTTPREFMLFVTGV